MSKLEALFDAVIVKPLSIEEQSYGNIIVPDMGKEKNEKATVIAIGPGKSTITGELIPTILQEGDIVVLPTMGATRFEHDGEEYYVIPENNILAKIIKTK